MTLIYLITNLAETIKIMKRAIIRLLLFPLLFIYTTISALLFFPISIFCGFEGSFEMLFSNDFSDFLMDNME